MNQQAADGTEFANGPFPSLRYPCHPRLAAFRVNIRPKTSGSEVKQKSNIEPKSVVFRVARGGGRGLFRRGNWGWVSSGGRILVGGRNWIDRLGILQRLDHASLEKIPIF